MCPSFKPWWASGSSPVAGALPVCFPATYPGGVFSFPYLLISSSELTHYQEEIKQKMVDFGKIQNFPDIDYH
ncbi:MAG: hypothetical protein F6K31_03170 [Symploca sp. SIO2G7]|nr:hypothetical protein [Symploca sp. SIO2G7]